MSSINNIGGVRSMGMDIDLGPGMSIQLLFAKLQLSQSMLCKDEASKYMKQIQDTQKMQKEIGTKLAEARRLKELAEKSTPPDANAAKAFLDYCKANDIPLPSGGKEIELFSSDEATQKMLEAYAERDPEIKKLLEKNPGALTKADAEAVLKKVNELRKKDGQPELKFEAVFKMDKGLVYNKTEWALIEKNITGKQETIGNNTQTMMVFLQDFIGQYNSFLQGANSAIAQANQVMTSIAKGQ